MISDEVEADFSPEYPWRVRAIPAIRKLIPGGPLPEGDARADLFARATAKEPEAIQRLYHGSLYFLIETVAASAGSSWRKTAFFLHFLSAYVLDALVRHDAKTDGSLERFLALQTACGFANAQEEWCQRPAPTFQEQVERTTLQLRLGSTHPDDELLDAFSQRTPLTPEAIHRALSILNWTHVPVFPPGPAVGEEDAENDWLPGSSNAPDDLTELAHPDDPDPILDPEADHVELAGTNEQTEESLLSGYHSPYAETRDYHLAIQVRRVLATLTPREEKVIRMRFGIGHPSDHTLEEVGQDFEVTRERIRQIEAKVLRTLRHPARSRYLQPFVTEHGYDWNPYGDVLPPAGHEFDVEPWNPRRVRFACHMTPETALAFYRAFSAKCISGLSDPLITVLRQIGLVHTNRAADGSLTVSPNMRRLSYFQLIIDPNAESCAPMAYPLEQGRWKKIGRPSHLVRRWEEILLHHGLIPYG